MHILELYKSGIILYVLIFHLSFLRQANILLSSFDLRLYSFMKYETFWTMSSWNAFFVSPPLGTLITCILGHLMLSQNSLIFSSFDFVSLFSVHFILESFYYSVFKCTNLLSYSVYLLLILPNASFHLRHGSFHFWKFIWGHLLYLPHLYFTHYFFASSFLNWRDTVITIFMSLSANSVLRVISCYV